MTLTQRVIATVVLLALVNAAGWFVAPTATWALLRFQMGRPRDPGSDTAPRSVAVYARALVVVASLLIAWIALWQ